MKILFIGLLALASMTAFAETQTLTLKLEQGQIAQAPNRNKQSIVVKCVETTRAFESQIELESGASLPITLGDEQFAIDDNGNAVALKAGDRVIFKCK